MKNCLIIAHPRSGSSNLCRSIASAYNLEMCFEPFSKGKVLTYDTVTKVIITRRPPEFFFQLTKRYEKIILLSRKDSIASAESLAALATSGTSNVDYKWTKLSPEALNQRPMRIKQIIDDKNNIELLSNYLDIPIDYYEDIYSKYTLKDSSIKLDTRFFHPSRKCKVEKHPLI